MTQITLAYRSAAVMAMLEEANFFSRKLGLHNSAPLRMEDIEKLFVRPPRMGFGGVVQTTNFFFSFDSHGKLWNLTRMENGNNYLDVSKFDAWSRTTSLIDTNGAYHMATQWLSAVSVDVADLERRHQKTFYQWFVWATALDPKKAAENPLLATNKVLLPIFDVKWGTSETPTVQVTILGSTKELMEIRMNDSSYSRRPSIVISNWQELLKIPDPPKKQLQAPVPAESMERTNAPQQTQSNAPPPFQRRLNPSEAL